MKGVANLFHGPQGSGMLFDDGKKFPGCMILKCDQGKPQKKSSSTSGFCGFPNSDVLYCYIWLKKLTTFSTVTPYNNVIKTLLTFLMASSNL